MNDGEIDSEESRRLAESGARIYVFINSPSDLAVVEEALGGKAVSIDIGEARGIMFGSQSFNPEAVKKKFRGSVIVCPHGNTSLMFVKALSAYGVTAYSLSGGIEGLKSRN